MPQTLKISDAWVAADVIQALLAADRQGAAARQEPCGALLGYHVPRGTEVLEAVTLPNAHATPGRGFALEPEAVLAASRDARSRGLDLVGFWHAHLEGPAWPGMLDEEGMRNAQGEGIGPFVHLVVGRGSTGKRVLRAFRMGRNHPKPVAMHLLTRARGSQRSAEAEPTLV